MSGEEAFQIAVIVAYVIGVPFGLWMKRDHKEFIKEREEQARLAQQGGNQGQQDQSQPG